MKVKLFLFGSIRDAFDGRREITLELDEHMDTKALLSSIVSNHPQLQSGALAIAVNKKYVTEPVELNEGDEVALLPPISGG
jgi:molybdopterin converting factor small subunit